ncbi:MAG: hypothetical protein H0W73_03330 [Bacteroidetes bacterium]|nr:hypothetical protein [Bacteroidota bacterium]
MSTDTEEQNLRKGFRIALILIIGSVVTYGCYMFNHSASWQTKGQFGDMFGVLNAIFSGLAFAVLIYTALMQRIELKLQREELKLQRDEMTLNRVELKRQADAQQSTEIIMKTQLAESTFFNLMKNYRDSIYPELSEKFMKQILTLKTGLQNYNSAVNVDIPEFKNFTLCQSTPFAIYKFLPIVKQVGENLIHIANFIHANLKVEENNRKNSIETLETFYHTSFYYSLSADEQFLIGFICANSFDPRTTDFLFNYTREYRNAKTYVNEEESGYFPPIDLEYFREPRTIYIKSPSSLTTQEINEIALKTTLSLKYPSSVKFKGIIYYKKYQENARDPETEKMIRNLVYKPTSSEFDLYAIFNEQLFPIFTTNCSVVSVKLGFNFEYKEQEFIVYAEMLRVGLDLKKAIENKGFELIFDF